MPHQHFGNADSTITIDLDAIIANWRYIDGLSVHNKDRRGGGRANGYGLGSCGCNGVAQAGCKLFFVARLAEAIELRTVFRQTGHDEFANHGSSRHPTRAGGRFCGPSIGTRVK